MFTLVMNTQVYFLMMICYYLIFQGTVLIRNAEELKSFSKGEEEQLEKVGRIIYSLIYFKALVIVISTVVPDFEFCDSLRARLHGGRVPQLTKLPWESQLFIRFFRKCIEAFTC